MENMSSKCQLHHIFPIESMSSLSSVRFVIFLSVLCLRASLFAFSSDAIISNPVTMVMGIKLLTVKYRAENLMKM